MEPADRRPGGVPGHGRQQPDAHPGADQASDGVWFNGPAAAVCTVVLIVALLASGLFAAGHGRAGQPAPEMAAD